MSLKKLAGRFGSMVIGAERAAREKLEVKAKTTRFGPMVLGSKVNFGTNTPAKDSKPVIPNPSLKQLKELLQSNPAFVVMYCAQEFARQAEAIRPAALRLFIDTAPVAFPKQPEKAQTIILRCQTWLDKAKDTEQEQPLDKSRIARGKQAGLTEVNSEPGADKVKAATGAKGGVVAKGSTVGKVKVK